jgi:hypothetical protein
MYKAELAADMIKMMTGVEDCSEGVHAGQLDGDDESGRGGGDGGLAGGKQLRRVVWHDHS